MEVLLARPKSRRFRDQNSLNSLEVAVLRSVPSYVSIRCYSGSLILNRLVDYSLDYLYVLCHFAVLPDHVPRNYLDDGLFVDTWLDVKVWIDIAMVWLNLFVVTCYLQCSRHVLELASILRV